MSVLISWYKNRKMQKGDDELLKSDCDMANFFIQSNIIHIDWLKLKLKTNTFCQKEMTEECRERLEGHLRSSIEYDRFLNSELDELRILQQIYDRDFL